MHNWQLNGSHGKDTIKWSRNWGSQHLQPNAIIVIPIHRADNTVIIEKIKVGAIETSVLHWLLAIKDQLESNTRMFLKIYK